MKFEYVEVMTEQNIKLFGCLSSNKNKSCILYIPGLSGNFFEAKFARMLGKKAIECNYDFLFSHNQGSFQIMEFPYLRSDGKLKSITKGSAYEKFEDSVYDIDAWINYLKERKYEEIIAVCHSMGCNKIVYYLNQKPNNPISKVILLSPQDNVNFGNLEMHQGLLEEAIKNIKNGEGNKILSKKFLGFCLMSSETYYNEITNKNINNIPYKTENGDFSLIALIEKPIYLVIGTDDGGEKSLEYMKKIADNCKNAKYDIVKDANHTYKGKEEELIELIFDYLKQ